MNTSYIYTEQECNGMGCGTQEGVMWRSWARDMEIVVGFVGSEPVTSTCHGPKLKFKTRAVLKSRNVLFGCQKSTLTLPHAVLGT